MDLLSRKVLQQNIGFSYPSCDEINWVHHENPKLFRQYDSVGGAKKVLF